MSSLLHSDADTGALSGALGPTLLNVLQGHEASLPAWELRGRPPLRAGADWMQ